MSKTKRIINVLSDVSIGFCIGVILDSIFDSGYIWTLIGTAIAIIVVAVICFKEKGNSNEKTV